MTRITGEIIIGAPADVVFDFVADQRNEPAYNPHMVRSAKVTPGPVGQGTQSRSAVKSGGRLADGHRVHRLLAAIPAGLDREDGSGRVQRDAHVGAGWRWHARPKAGDDRPIGEQIVQAFRAKFRKQR